ncbi:MAG: hypothetical protein QOJ66_3127 [Ilumatobacteraceae bacterium]|jgi:deazaflavin-dependent oxidoreductase (nitroreductase family)
MTSAGFEAALLNSEELQLVTVGRKTGRESARPVWFVHRDGTLYLLPGDGRDSQWYRNALHTPTIRLSAGGTTQPATTRPITDEMQVAAVVNAFRDKYGSDQISALYPRLEVAVEAHALG